MLKRAGSVAVPVAAFAVAITLAILAGPTSRAMGMRAPQAGTPCMITIVIGEVSFDKVGEKFVVKAEVTVTIVNGTLDPTRISCFVERFNTKKGKNGSFQQVGPMGNTAVELASGVPTTVECELGVDGVCGAVKGSLANPQMTGNFFINLRVDANGKGTDNKPCPKSETKTTERTVDQMKTLCGL